MDDLGRFILPVAKALLGEPNAALSSKTELRFGSHGSMKIDVTKGTAYSFEEEVGGGVLWLIEREKKLSGKAAFDFMREIGCEVEPLSNGHDPEPQRIVATWDYVDEDGRLLFHVCKFGPVKRFAQRAPDGSWKVKGIRQVIYRLPEITEALAEGKTIFIVEGEKDADNLARWNIPATCNAGGAGKWRDEFAGLFAGADIVVIPDNDRPGRQHAERVAASLQGIAARVRYLALPGLPEKGDVSDWQAHDGSSPEAFHALVERAPVWGPRFESQFGALRWSEIGVAGPIGYEWVIEDIIPHGETVLVFGDSGTGKSFSTFDMMLCIARGIAFYNRNVEPGLVVYVAAEAGKGFSKRKIAYLAYHHLGNEEIPFCLITKRPDFFSGDTDVDSLITEITAITRTYTERLRIIVLDTLSAISPGMNENASADVSRVRARLQKLIDAFSVTTLLVHHKPKGGSTPRGHGSLTGDFETTIEYETTELKSSEGLSVHRATVRKQREGKKGQSWDFVLPVVVVGKNKWGNDETSCVVVPFDGKRPTLAYGFRANKAELVFLEALFDALNDKGTAPPAGLPQTIVKAVDIAEVRARMKERYLAADEDSTKADGRFRQAFKRAGDALKNGKVIGFRNPLVWYTGKPVMGLTATLVTNEVDAP